MLQFFRRYQKFFFVIVAFFIVLSFSFFGTFSTFHNRDEAPDREIGELVDGSVLKERKLQGLMRLLSYGIEEGGRSYNLLNGSLVHNSIMLSGVGEVLAKHLYDGIAEDLEAKYKRMKSYAPYTHPFAPYISASNIWGQFAPEINGALEELQRAPQEFGPEQISLLFRLYAAQADFPAPMLHQMLWYQQQQGEQVRPDPGLPGANVSLFGFQSIEDWLGPKFVEEVAKFILNSACVAKEEGYAIKKEEAQIDLLRNVYQAMRLFQQEGEPTSEEAHNAYANQIRSLGLHEKEALDLWTEVLLFRRLFDEVGESVFLDRLAFDQFNEFAKPSNRICRYRLPQELEFDTFFDMLKFQLYLETTCVGDYMSLPTEQRHPEEVMIAHPELAYKKFTVEIASTSLLEAAARIPIKETWDWEIDHYEKLCKEFPVLKRAALSSEEEKREVLDGLGENVRLKIDQHARIAMVKADPSRIDQVLASAKVEEETLKVRLEGGGDFSGSDFLALLETEDATLNRYSPDGDNFYLIRVVEKGKGWNLLTFYEATTDRTLDALLDRQLLLAYEKKETDKSFDACKDEIGQELYSDLLAAIDVEGTCKKLDDYASKRFDHLLSELRDLGAKDEDALSQALESSLWPLLRREEKLVLEPHHLAPGEFSPVEDGQFYCLLEQMENGASEQEIATAKELLKRDAEKTLTEKLLQRI